MIPFINSSLIVEAQEWNDRFCVLSSLIGQNYKSGELKDFLIRWQQSTMISPLDSVSHCITLASAGAQMPWEKDANR